MKITANHCGVRLRKAVAPHAGEVEGLSYLTSVFSPAKSMLSSTILLGKTRANREEITPVFCSIAGFMNLELKHCLR